ncbi:MAG: hypothetical protein BIFFINMI_02926 [Phycisphaerae bacterium]|nr:hypothetical protein [Phycisphaerae bacterium]
MPDALQMPNGQQPQTKTQSQVADWHYRAVYYFENICAVSAAVAESTPSNAKLLEWTRTFPPPQAWWDANDDPFSAAQK